MLTVLDLFSGIGGFSLGLERCGFKTIGFVEQDEYCRRVLAKNFPGVTIFEDVRTFDADGFGTVDVITGGPPCQPFSVAGEQRGADDDRDLWPEMHRIVAALKPRWAIVENVRGFVSDPLGLDRCISDLEESGYAVQPFVLPALGLDARHIRYRAIVIAHNLSNAQLFGLSQRHRLRTRRQETDPTASTSFRWPAEPGMDRVAHGVPNRMDRTKSLGNAVIPQLIEVIGNHIMEIEREIQ
jgi:DNA (cytosine-5)-methyltransferase 1